MPKKGERMPDWWREKISTANKGKKKTKEHIQKIVESRKGFKHTEDSKNKISRSLIGNKYGVGKKHTDEHKRKISDALIGNKWNCGKKLSEEHKKHIGDSIRGKPRYDLQGKPLKKETKEKISRILSELHSGNGNPSWRGGISFEPYCPKFNDAFKERVREFFGRKCVECGIKETNKKLHVHHVNYNKEMCCDDDKPLFVCLCASCHGKTHHNREYWRNRFAIIIKEQYNGECYLKKD